MRIVTATAPLALFLALAAPAAADQALDREFTFRVERFRLEPARDGDRLVVDGSLPDLTPGQPEWPWMSRIVDLPQGTRVASVEVMAIEAEPWERNVRIASARQVTRDGAMSTRTVPDAWTYQRPGFQPERLVELGPQGFQQGVAGASMRICPVRWDASRGALERIRSVRVRLHLEASTATPVTRLRDSDPATTQPSRSGASPLASGFGNRRPATPFMATQIPSLLGSPVAYVIITNDELVPEFQRLADWKTQTGVPAVVRTLSFIRSQYPRGADDAERIRTFIRDAYTRWGTKWILLGGDTDVIPVRLPHSTYFGGDDIASDLYYSCLDGNWDADGDKIYGESFTNPVNPGDDVDFFPEVYVGRATVTNLATAKQFVDRTLQYIRNPIGDYERSILIFAEVLFPENWKQPSDGTLLDGGTLGDELLPYINDNPSMRTTRMYQNWTDPAWVPGVLPETKATVLDSLSRGYGFAVHIGHGYRNVMSLADANMFSSDALALTNGQRLFNLYAVNCTSNAIDFPCIGEAFLQAPNGGAVTSVGSTRLDFPYSGRTFERDYFKAVFADSITAVGQAQAQQKINQISASQNENAYRWMQFSLLLLGDPELRMWTGTPRTLAVTHPSTVALKDTSLSVTVMTGGFPLAGARVTAYKAGDGYASGLTDASGLARLTFQADTLGTVVLTVTGYDCKPYQANLNVVASPSASVLAEGAPIIDDDAVGGTTGDGDGFWDAGETIDFRIPIRNAGGISASSVFASLSTADTMVTVIVPNQSYGTIAAGAVVTSSGAFRVRLSLTAPDQHEVAFKLQVIDGGGGQRYQTFSMTTRAPELYHFSHTYVDVGGIPNGRPDVGETCTMTPTLKNLGTGDAHSVTAVLRSLDGQCTIADSMATWGNLAAGEERNASDTFIFTPLAANAVLELTVTDSKRKQLVRTIDLDYPATPTNLSGLGEPNGIKLTWSRTLSPDLMGYNVYRSTSGGGPFTRVNTVPTDRIAYYLDSPLAALTLYYYQIAAVDSGGNESTPTAIASVSTNPPMHSSFPIPMNASSNAPPTVEHLSPGHPLDILSGSDFIYAWHADGTALIDADGGGATNGDFTVTGSNYEGGVSVGDIDGDGLPDVVGVASDSTQIVALNRSGQRLAGNWPQPILDRVWSSVALGDLDNDGDREMVFGGYGGPRIYAFKKDGSEWLDGDSNPSTNGVFKVVGTTFNIGTPAIADLDGNGIRDIIEGAFDGKLYAWRPDGTNLPGFPVTLPEPITASVAVGYLDGPGDTQLDIVVLTGYYPGNNPNIDSLYVFNAAGARRAGFPKALVASETGKAPSPALADMNNDGFLDIVVASTNGKLYVYDRNGNIVGPWNAIPYSILGVDATEASPVVADIDGDGTNDIVIGDEAGYLTAIGGAGNVLPGFPIPVGVAIKSAAALCDCDGDGKTEIVISGSDRDVMMWDYDFPFSPAGPPPWPQFHHDAMRTGLATNKVFVDVTPEPHAAPQRLELAAPTPNPSRETASMWYAIPKVAPGEQLELAVYDLSGRQLRVLQHGEARPGRARAEWDLTDGGGRRVEPGLYFLRLRVGSKALGQKIIVMQ